MKTKVKKNFNTEKFMYRTRDKISTDIANMDYEEIKEYYTKKRDKNRIKPTTMK